MVDNVYNIARSLRNELSQADPRSPLLNITHENSLKDILRASQRSSSNAFKYWMIIFLIHLEDNDPPRVDVSHGTLTEKLAECIGMMKALFNHRETLSTLCELVDGILCNEIQECSDMDKFVDWIEAGQSLSSLNNDVSFDFKKSAFLFLVKNVMSDITDFTSDRNKQKIPSTLNYLFRAFNCNIIQKELSYFIVDPVLEFIEDNYLNREVPPQEFQHAYKMIEQLATIVRNNEQNSEIKSIYDRCSQRVDPNSIIVNQPIQPVMSSMNDITEDRISKNHFPMDVPRNVSGIIISLYNGKLDSKIDVVIKQYQFSNSRVENNKMIENEKSIYEKLNSLANEESNCFLKFYGTYFTNDSIFMVMEAVNKDLTCYMTEKKRDNSEQSCIPESQFLNMAKSLVTSYSLMIDNGICHFDIKPGNLLISNSLKIKIIDFNCSIIRKVKANLQQLCKVKLVGTEQYWCPQKKQAKAQGLQEVRLIPEKSDVYSLGLVFYQLLTCKNIEGKSVMIANLNGLKDISQETKSFIEDMLEDEPDERPSFSDLPERINVTKSTLLASRLSSIIPNN